MAESEDSVSSFSSHRSRRREQRTHMIPERDTFIPDAVTPPPTQDKGKLLKPRLPRPRRGSGGQRNLITVEAETHVIRMSPQNDSPPPRKSSGNWNDHSDREEAGRRNETEIPPIARTDEDEGAKAHCPPDIHQRLSNMSSEDESLCPAESKDKDKLPPKEFLAIPMPSTPSDILAQPMDSKDENPDELKVRSGRGSKAKSSFIRKWTKKVVESYGKSSSVEREDERDEEALVSFPVAGEEVIQSEPVLLTVDEVKKPRRRKKKNVEKRVLIVREKVEVLSLGSPPSKRDLRRREKAGEFTADEKILGVKIHHTDVLANDSDVYHPVVQVRAMDSKGNPIPKMSQSAAELKRERVLGQVEIKGKEERTMTRPFQISGSRFFGYIPKWEEMVFLETPFERLVSAEAETILFFEILDFPPISHRSEQRNVKSDMGWHRVGWSFLKPVAKDGTTYVNRRIRLQLYKPEGENVYECWKSRKWKKLNSTLYVTLKGVLPPERQTAEQHSLASLLSLRKEELTEALIEGQIPTNKSSSHSEVEVDGVRNLGKVEEWSRLPGQSCKVPNRLEMSLPVSELDSLEMRVTGNVHSLKFSPCGHFLAGGLDASHYHVTLIFQIPSGKLVRSLRGHHGLIYEVDWKQSGEDAALYFLATASADSTVRLWAFDTRDNEAELVSVLGHPSFVYSVAFSPSSAIRLVTGCFDSVIRIWEVPNNSRPTHVSAPIFLIDGHRSHINSVRFHPTGQLFFSGDGEGNLCQWTFSNSNHAPSLYKWSSDGALRRVVFADTNQWEVRLGACISCLSVDVTGRKLLVQLKESILEILDVETFLVLHSFRGHENKRLRLQSVLSPCGNLVLCGSEDSCLCVWEATTGRLLSHLRPPNHRRVAVSAVSFHPWDNYVALGLSSGVNEPQPILIYTHDKISGGGAASLKKVFPGNHVQGQPGRGDSSEKFRSILQKLEELTPHMATVTSRLMEKEKALKK